MHLLTGDRKHLDEGARKVKILELFNGMQPDYHLDKVAIRHWDGCWFGKRPSSIPTQMIRTEGLYDNIR